MLLGTEFVGSIFITIFFFGLVEYWVVLVNRILTVPCLLMTTDMYCIFSIKYSFVIK